jgi:hypothetical protein
MSVDGLETRRWNGTKSAFADCTEILVPSTRFAATSA